MAYRACVLTAAWYGRELRYGERGGTFMSLVDFADGDAWRQAVAEFFQHQDSLPHHYIMHLAHGAEILGYKHPDRAIRGRWLDLYSRMAADLHLGVESEADMDERLGDWGRKFWDEQTRDEHLLKHDAQ